MRRITLDIETEGNFRANGDFSNLEITVVGVHDTETDQYVAYVKEELPQLWPTLERADFLVGYNSDHFDIPILNKYYAGNLGTIKSVDLMKEVQAVLGRRLKLDNIAEATLGKKKSGHGLEAGKWWKEGLVEKVKAYCLDDVRLTVALYEYALKNGKLKYKEYGENKARDIRLDTSGWETVSAAPAMTHTLPF